LKALSPLVSAVAATTPDADTDSEIRGDSQSEVDVGLVSRDNVPRGSVDTSEMDATAVAETTSDMVADRARSCPIVEAVTGMATDDEADTPPV
jgi:hypothetical protein